MKYVTINVLKQDASFFREFAKKRQITQVSLFTKFVKLLKKIEKKGEKK